MVEQAINYFGEDQHLAIKENDVSNPVDKVFGNDLLLQKIISYLGDPRHEVKMKLTCHRFKYFYDRLESAMKTLIIEKVMIKNYPFVVVKYENAMRVLKLGRVDQLNLEKVLDFIPKNEISLINKVVIKGIESYLGDPWRWQNLLKFSGNLAAFLDEFVGLKHLELRCLVLQRCLPSDFQDSLFIKRITTLVILENEMTISRFMPFIGPKIKKLHVHESKIRLGNYASLQSIPNSVEIVIIHLDDKKWPPSNVIQPHMKPNFYTLPWHLAFKRRILFRGNEFKPIKHCKNMRHLKLIKQDRKASEKSVLKTISELPHSLSHLEKLTFDGYYTRKEIRKLIKVLKNCKKLIILQLRMRRFTGNKEDWLRLIKNLPKTLRCVKFDSIVSDRAITALQNRLSGSLVNLEIRIRQNQLSLSSQKMIYEDFPKLRYLRINGIVLDSENIALLKNCQIRRIEFRTPCSQDTSATKTELLKYYYETTWSNAPRYIGIDWYLNSRQGRIVWY